MPSSDTTRPNQQVPTFTSADDFLAAMEHADNRRERRERRRSRGQQEEHGNRQENEVLLGDDEEEDLDDDDDDGIYNDLRKRNIEDDTRDGYHGCMKRLTLWLYDNLPEALDRTCITRLDTIKSSNEYDAKTKQTMMNKDALAFMKAASENFHPILFSKVTVESMNDAMELSR